VRVVLIYFIRALHYLLVGFNLLAWVIPSVLVLKIHLWFIPLMIVQWRLNRNTCVLSNLEQLLLGRPAYGAEGEGQFIKSLLDRCFNNLPSDRVIEGGTYVLLVIVWLLSFAHLIFVSSGCRKRLCRFLLESWIYFLSHVRRRSVSTTSVRIVGSGST